MKDYTYRYSVQLICLTGYNTPAGWATRSRIGHALPSKLTGKPNGKKLAAYVADYNASLSPNGVNSHIGLNGTAVRAYITDHQTKTVVATWEKN